MALSPRPRHRKTAAMWAASLLAATGLALISPKTPPAKADACADVDVSFARGTNEPPGIGYVGESFTDQLTDALPGKKIDVYAVDYPAVYSAQSVGDGGNDLSEHVQNIARTCPNTKIVIGGFSQGAAVVDLVTVSPIPAQTVEVPFMGEVSLADSGFDKALPANVFPHIAAVALFGNPAKRVFDGVLPMPDGLRARTTDVCAEADPVCHPPSPDDLANYHNHDSYVERGLTDEVAEFVRGKLGFPNAPAPPKNAPAPPKPSDSSFAPIPDQNVSASDGSDSDGQDEAGPDEAEPDDEAPGE
ncbi:cutinase family protein [Segniliparus rugosus]|uniref:Cutinase n=1 Tax=Segniliparus rugosus (strain ATCC BAA-974 / DSM 45345 / CCUG 50838 / CIP 108380 / JCM 13579 / CDC 945) TaxID=679197 RepID=E5XPT7_SEGRC|nr:cutinase family protein [Segniliparus rugosus]EFV13624.2 hypothetical protein HMPREF9336_01509 [Segniliparus rugosus ATCC BAA-974]